MSEEYPISLDQMEDMVGGSALDDLRAMMKIDCLEEDDIVFKMIMDPSIDLTQVYDIEPGTTFMAHCVKHITSDYKFLGDEWQPI
jgi:hypothetical protein